MPRRSWPHGASASRARGPPPPGRPVIDHRGRLLVAALGFANGPSEPRVAVPPGARDAARSLLIASGSDGRLPLVAVAPGAAYGGAKRWPPASFAERIDGLGADGVQCVIVGTAADAPTAHHIGRSAKAVRSIVNLVGRTDLTTLAGVLASCRALVTNDSGAMHLAAAIGISVTAMFGPTDETATSPRLDLRPRGAPPSPLAGTEVSSNLRPHRQPPSPPAGTEVMTLLTHPVWCRPCMLRECPLDHRCMRGIDVAAVLAAARSGL